jgi:hypothetical protein
MPRTKTSTVNHKLPQVGKGRTPYERQKAKAAFLSAYASCAILHKSCDIARNNVGTIRYWLSTGFLQQSEIDQSYEQYQDRIRDVLHELAIEGINKPLSDRHGHILLDGQGNPVYNNTKDSKILLKMASKHLPEYKDDVSGHSSNAVTINIGTSPNNLYYVGIDLHDWQLDDVRDLIAVVKRGESNKISPEGQASNVQQHSVNVVESQV